MPDDVVVVTGANNGIGLGLTRALLALGRRVAGIDLSTENLPGGVGFVCDITDPDQVEATINAVVKKWGRVDVLVNNACLAIFAPFEEKPVLETRQEFEVNYFGHINLIKAVLPVMKAQGGGVIHNVSSTVGMSGFYGIHGYASCKGALDALSRTLAYELESYGITVNIIYPPLTKTRSSKPLGIPMQFMSDPDEVGRRLAPRIGSRKRVVTPGATERFGATLARIMPWGTGRFMSSRALAARTGE